MSFSPNFEFTRKNVLITGASTGIGAHCAMAFAESNANVILVSRGSRELDSVENKINIMGKKVEKIVCDITDKKDFDEKIAHISTVDVLINNAGTNIPGSLISACENDFDKVMGINVRAAFFVSQSIVRKMIKHGTSGSIINLSSQMGHVGAKNRTIYCTSKHAIEGLTKSMAVELASDGIRVNSVAPTFVETPMTQPFLEEDEFRDEVLSKIPLGKIAHTGDIIGAILFLAGDASTMITGSCIKIDGGWTAV
jgi:NAD(P)-dependent dehydrogenase (short-subunit alcohol dehydrogenase family)